jgi:hypothetical protein
MRAMLLLSPMHAKSIAGMARSYSKECVPPDGVAQAHVPLP